MAYRIEEIVEFAELGNYIDEPMRTYSAGMCMRLGFSVAALLDPDVLILDEVFAVGDIAFQKKCIDRIHEFKRGNRTILFCSHNIYELRQLCDEAIWLRDGRLSAKGDVVTVTGDYFTHLRTSKDTAGAGAGSGAQDGTDGAARDLPRIQDVRYYRMGTDEEIEQAKTGDSIEIRVWWEKPAAIGHVLQLGIAFIREDNIVCTGIGTHFDGLSLEGERGCMALRLPSFQMLAGRYLVAAMLLDQTGTHIFHEYVAARRLVFPASMPHLGVFAPDHGWIALPRGSPP
jgi:lipopolysaccharide transport system ATP-binding protein